MKRILVTGGAGYIGSHTSLCLIRAGYKVIILDSLRNSSIKAIERMNLIIERINPKLKENLNFIKGDIRQFELLNKIFIDALAEGIPIDSVIHFSGLKSIAESKMNPLDYWDVNTVGTINLLKTMELNNCRKLIFSSSASIYGEKDNTLIKESYSLKPVNPYANTKVTVEEILKDIIKSKKSKWNFTTLRYFNPIGAHSSGLIGESPLGRPNNLFPLILNSFINNIKIDIFGNDWPTYDGTCIRDFIHVEDLSEAHVKALENLESSSEYLNCFNIGTGLGTSVLDLINVFIETNNVNVHYGFTSRREGDVAILVADNSLAIRKLNWKPRRTLQQMCKDGYKWITNNPKGYE